LNFPLTASNREAAFYRFTTLWAFSEAFLGGLLHGLHLPVTGLILGSFSVFCMATIYLVTQETGKILKATMLVVLVKGILSPHSPPTAYIAVLFQGLVGTLLFSVPIKFIYRILIISILCLAESALQRVLVLTLIFGNGLWEAVDEASQAIAKQFGLSVVPNAARLIQIYAGIHVMVGFYVGIVLSRLPVWIQQKEFVPDFSGIRWQEKTTVVRSKNKWYSTTYIIILAFLGAGIYQVYVADSWLASLKNKPFLLLIRAGVFLVLWYWVLIPILRLALRDWWKSRTTKYAGELQHILTLMPEMRLMVVNSWKLHKDKMLYSRIIAFIKTLISVCIHFPKENFKSETEER